MRLRFAVAAAFAVVAAFAVTSSAKDCEDVAGPFSAVPPATCSSPVHICTHGTLTGGLPSTYDFVATSQTVSGPVASLTGNSTITLDQGGAVLHGQDTSSLSLVDGAFTTTVHIVDGTHQYKRASGTIVAVGVFDFATGGTSGSYSGTICKHKDGGQD